MINVGYAIKIGETRITYNTVISLILLLISLLLISRKKYNQGILLVGSLLWGFIFVGLVMFSLFPYKGGMIQNIVEWDGFIRGDAFLTYSPKLPSRLFNYLLAAFRYPIILSVAASVFTVRDIRLVVNKLYRLIYIVFVYGIFEVIAKKVLHSQITTTLVNAFFGNEGLVFNADRLNGFTKEPSQYAVVLFAFCMLTIIYNRFGFFKRKRRFWINLLFLFSLMLLSGSLASYYLLAISLLCVLMTSSARNKAVIIVSCVLGGFVILLTGLPEYVVERLGRVSMVLDAILSGTIYQSYATSEGARLISISQMLKCLSARPICGVGLGVTDAHSTFFALLANVGCLGSFMYYKIWYMFAKVKTAENKKLYCIVIISTLFVGGIGYFSEIYLPFIILCYSVSSKGRYRNENNYY